VQVALEDEGYAGRTDGELFVRRLAGQRRHHG
jgi:hypothetical protein